MIKLIIAGGRDFDNYKLFQKETQTNISEINDGRPIQIVQGVVKGVDALGSASQKNMI